MQTEQIQIFDTTLRDGQQSPGAGMSFEQNLAYADMAAQLKIDVLEAGFPAASQQDFDIVHTIAERCAERQDAMTIAALCQLREAQVVRTMEALAPSQKQSKARVHFYLPVDPNLMAASLGKMADQKETLIDQVHQMAKLAHDAGYEVEFSPEGYSRQGDNFDFVTDVIHAAIAGGATIINCPDTIGGAAEYEGAQYFVRLMQRHADLMAKAFPDKNIVWSTHCHNDFGLAVQNSLNAVFNGPARQIEGCINGVGERAGNAALEQCIMIIDQFGQRVHPDKHFVTGCQTEYLAQASDFIAQHMLPRQPHSPVTGMNAARHTSGGHTNAILNNPLAYQPFDPKAVGSEINFVFGPLSGGNHAQNIIQTAGYQCANDEKASIAQAIKDHYAERRKGVTDSELVEAYCHYRAPIKVRNISYAKAEEHTTLSMEGHFFGTENLSMQYDGKNSALAALSEAVNAQYPGVTIKNYHSESANNAAIDAPSRATIIIAREDDVVFTGVAEDQDIEMSAMKAFIAAVNEAYVDQHFRIKEAS